MDFFWPTIGWLLVRPTDELAPDEAKVGGRLHGNDFFETARRRMELRAWCRSHETLDVLAPAVTRFVERIAADQKVRRTAATAKMHAEFKNLSLNEATQKWWKDANSHITGWVTDYMGKNADHLGLPADMSSWPSPESQQTAYAMHSYYMARIVMNVGLGRRIGDGDVHDAHHYAAARYADAFVSEDGAFKATVALIPNQSILLMSFNEFALELGVPPH